MISSVSNAGPGSHSQARAQQLAIRGDPVSPCRTTNGCNMPSRWQHVRRDAFATRQTQVLFMCGAGGTSGEPACVRMLSTPRHRLRRGTAV